MPPDPCRAGARVSPYPPVRYTKAAERVAFVFGCLAIVWFLAVLVAFLVVVS